MGNRCYAEIFVFLQNSRHNTYQTYWCDSSTCEQPTADKMQLYHQDQLLFALTNSSFTTVVIFYTIFEFGYRVFMEIRILPRSRSSEDTDSYTAQLDFNTFMHFKHTFRD